MVCNAHSAANAYNVERATDEILKHASLVSDPLDAELLAVFDCRVDRGLGKIYAHDVLVILREAQIAARGAPNF
jgi:hypothetical protein